MGPIRLRPLALLMVLALGLAAPARAQNNPPMDESIDLQLFQPAQGPHAFLTVSGAEVLANKRFQLSLDITYLTHPFTVFAVNSGDMLTTRSEVVSSIFAGQLAGSYGFGGQFQAGVVLPVILSLKGDGLDPETGAPMAGGLSASGLGDLYGELVIRVYQAHGVSLAAIPAFTVPTSTSKDSFLGDDLPSFRPRGAAEWNLGGGKVDLGANLGLILRKPHTIYSSDVGQQITYGVAAALHAHQKLDVVAEVFGRKGFTSDLDESPLEVDGALKIFPSQAFSVFLGGGGGIVKGIGSPAVRLFAGLGWSPDFGDADSDGIDNMHDRCPNEKEDKDGFQDTDGCPELDNDADGIPDDADKCPNDAEDKDGFEDDDGCPDTDNDKDGIPDEKDACPNDVEDKMPPRPDDGCPARKAEPEEGAAAPAAPGAPAAPKVSDKDGDGVADLDDKCPDAPETINGVDDSDGCPDKGGKAMARMEGNKLVLVQAPAFDGTALKPASQAALGQAALYMKRPAVKKWRIVVSAEKQKKGGDAQAVAQGRAAAVKAYLVSQGVPDAAIETGTAEATGKAMVVIVAADKGAEEQPAIEINP